MTQIWATRGVASSAQTHPFTEGRSSTGALKLSGRIQETKTMVEMHFVDSTNVEQLGYDPATSELHVRFVGKNELYVYLNVPEPIFQEFFASPSKGSYLNR